MSDVSLLGSYGGAGGAGLMFRNKLINGNFDIWQRGTSQTSSGYGSDDRWLNVNNVSTKTHSQQAFSLGQTDVPGNPKYFSRTVVSSVVGANNYVVKIQRIEGVETLAGKKATLSFWAKADSNKNIAIELAQEFGTGGTPSSSVTGIGSQKVALTSSWQKFEISVDIPSVAGKTLGTDGKDHLAVIFWLDAGSNLDARTDSLGQQSGTFDIAQVQLEEGPVASPFEQRPIGMELSLCQRYCQVFEGDEPVGGFGVGGTDTNGTQFQIPHFLRQEMRAKPTGTVSGTFRVYYSNTADTSVSVSVSAAGYNALVLLLVDGVSVTPGTIGRLARNNNSTAKITIEAEL